MTDDLISRDELRENMLYAMCGTGYQSVALREIDLMPTVDAVPVIRCSECEHWRANTQYCDVFSGIGSAHRMPPNGYCSEAERKL